MTNEWNKKRIGHDCKVGDGAHAKIKRQNAGIIYLTSKNLKDGKLDLSKIDFISPSDYERHFNEKSTTLNKPKAGDVLFSIIGSIGEPYLVRPQDLFGLSSSVSILRANTKIIFPKYLYYWIRGHIFQNALYGIKGGVAQGYVSLEMIKSLPLEYPKLPTQHKIASILSAYNDLIENNTRRIMILEEMAQALYREWFVEFRFPGHEKVKMVESELGMVPEGWEINHLRNHISLDKGISYKGKFLTDDGIPMVNLKCILPFGGFKREGTKPYSGDYKSKHTIKPSDLVIANTDLTQAGNVIGSPAIVPSIQTNGDILISHHLYAIRFISNTQITKYFLYNLMLTHDFKSFAKGRANGTTVLGLAQDGVLDFSFAKPPIRLLNQFEILMESIYGIIEKYELKNNTLRSTRDLLLPKLISGEVDVSSLDIPTGELT